MATLIEEIQLFDKQQNSEYFLIMHKTCWYNKYCLLSFPFAFPFRSEGQPEENWSISMSFLLPKLK